jgi:nucleotide-binding universal stress UspA family protein
MTETYFSIDCIVAATDFSANGDLAVMRGAHIAKRGGKALHLLHVVHPLDIYPELMLSFDSHIKDYERLKQANGIESLDKLAIKIRNDFNIEVITASRIGRAHTQIAEYAKEESADVVVVGYRGDANVIDAVMGSTAFRLLRTADCPVLIVKNDEVVPYKEVVAAVDLGPLSTKVAASACRVAPNAHVELLHVFDLKQEVLSREVGTSDADIKSYREEAMKHIDQELSQLLAKIDIKNMTSRVENGYLPENICGRVVEINADLIVLGKKDKSSLQEFVLGSVSKTVAGMVECDVLLL